MIPRGTSGLIGLGLAAALLAVLPLLVSPYYVELGTYALISAMLALSLQATRRRGSSCYHHQARSKVSGSGRGFF